MKILVTGGAGFIGSHLSEKLSKLGHKVKILDNFCITRDNTTLLEKLGCEIIEGDICDVDVVEKAVCNVDAIYHLAAMNRAQKSIDDPIGAHDVNVNGTLNLLEAARKYNIKRFINISSSSVYGNSDVYPRKEGNETLPPHPYAVGKLTGEHYVRVYHEIYGLDALTLRFFSVYGPRQKGNIPLAAVIPKFIYNTYYGDSIEVYGDGEQTRNFTYVKDVVSGCVSALDSEISGTEINIANKEEYSVNQMLNLVEKTLKMQAKINYAPRLKGDPVGNAADISKAIRLLKYNPRYGLEEGVQETVDWYLNVLKVESEEVKPRVCVVGLGYVGLPLALEFSKELETFGFDINSEKILELKRGFDRTSEIEKSSLELSTLKFSSSPDTISEAEYIIAAVPTPIKEDKSPDLSYVKSVSELIGSNMKKGAIVIFESTVYPGLTEEICVPILETVSGLKYKIDFKVAYSPERINPGDKKHTIDKIVKVVGACDEETLDKVSKLYGIIVKAGIHKAPNIKTAEAAKVIENIQRDLNISLANELSLIFRRMDINTKDVIEAAGTKWNFHKYYPGFVGGHCIPVDPYYLTTKAESLGYMPKVILAGRDINEFMPKHVAHILNNGLNRLKKPIRSSKVLILGLTFKENLSDIRHSRVSTLIDELKNYGVDLYCYDPLVSNEISNKEFGVPITDIDSINSIDAIILVTAHNEFRNISLKSLRNKTTNNPILIDVKGLYDSTEAKELGFKYTTL